MHWLLPVFTLASLQTQVCPDITGRYVIQGEDGRVYVTIEQTGCGTAVVGWIIRNYDGTSGASRTLTLDGRFQPDSGWFGLGKQLSAAQFKGDTLEIVARSPAATDTTKVGWRLRLHVMPNKDLCTRFYDGHAQSVTVAARIGPKGESAAAARAEAANNGGLTTSCR